jgi:hypothetical protein
LPEIADGAKEGVHVLPGVLNLQRACLDFLFRGGCSNGNAMLLSVEPDLAGGGFKGT